MDFVALASATAPRKLLRHLAGATAGAAGEDDDFVHLAADTTSAEAGADYASGGLYGERPGTPYEQQFGGAVADSSSPLLSPTAEAELFLLATNFLLYVAMVIITTMVCKIYFPQSLERGSAESQGVSSSRMSYVRVRSIGSRQGSTENDEEGKGKNMSSYYSSDNEDESSMEGAGGEDEEDFSSDEDDDKGGSSDEESESDGLLLEMEEPDAGGVAGSTPHRRRNKCGGRKRAISGGNFLEFDQTTTSRNDVMKRLGLCVLMLNLTFVTWGVLQERMLTRRYPRITGEYFTYSYALVFTNRFWTLIMSGGLLIYLKPRRSKSTIIYEYSFPSISNMLSSWCQYEALKYVSFPAATLFKSFKLAPVMAMGKMLGNKEYPQYDYIVALFIGLGITMFMSGSEDLEFGYDVHGEKASAAWTGVMLLGFFLFFDSFTSQWQSRMFQRHRDLSMIELMFATSAFSTVLSFITLVHTKELGPALSFVVQHSEIHLHFFLFSICSTIGQLFIFYTIKNFGAVVFAIIMTTRVLLSIALSCILYGHEVGSTGFLGLMVVMGAVCYRIKRKAEGKQLIRWQGIGDEKAMELVQEWHEHADM
jgi:adenosine 3'-phospho 5'-phosphosulfate transporter B2